MTASSRGTITEAVALTLLIQHHTRPQPRGRVSWAAALAFAEGWEDTHNQPVLLSWGQELWKAQKGTAGSWLCPLAPESARSAKMWLGTSSPEDRRFDSVSSHATGYQAAASPHTGKHVFHGVRVQN